ncbi:MAG TPA: hypothetical protein VFA09_01340 [Ktedonobacteraceae bacterium]|nr:hypothetical protein [Ktedonobacteraceae bacterium]
MKLELNTYNGWENKFTWLIHLHLSNEEQLMNELVELVAHEPNEGAAGRLVEMWVRLALDHWLTRFPGRNRQHDASLLLLVWDLAGSALAYADWDGLVALLVGEAQTCENLFTMTLYRNLLDDRQVQDWASRVMHEAPNGYAAADALHEGLRAMVDAWIDASALHRCKQAFISRLISDLIQNTYTLIVWEHVARAFRPG